MDDDRHPESPHQPLLHRPLRRARRRQRYRSRRCPRVPRAPAPRRMVGGERARPAVAVRPRDTVGSARVRSDEPADADEPRRAVLDRVDGEVAGRGRARRRTEIRRDRDVGTSRISASRAAAAGVRVRRRRGIRRRAAAHVRCAGRASRRRRLYGERGDEFRVRREDRRRRHERSSRPIARVRGRGVARRRGERGGTRARRCRPAVR